MRAPVESQRYRIAAAVTSRALLHPHQREGCGLFDPFSDMAEQKGYTLRVFKKGSLPFFLSLCSIFILFFPHFSARSFSFFHPSTLANAQWLCTVCGKNAPAAMRVVSFFPPGHCELSREKCTSREPMGGGSGDFFFIS